MSMTEFYWVQAARGAVPQGAVQGGYDVGGAALFVGRAPHEGDLLPAKVAPAHGCAFISWSGKEHRKIDYSVLCSRGPIKWQSASNGRVPMNALNVGSTRSGDRLFVGRVFHEGTLSLGMIHPAHGCCYVSYSGQQLSFKKYEVLLER